MTETAQQKEDVLSKIRELTSLMKDRIQKRDYILSEKLAWGHLYSGKSIEALKKQAKGELSSIRPVAHFLLMRVTENLVLDKRAKNRTIITMEDITTIKHANGATVAQEKGSFVDVDKDADPPAITIPDSGKSVDIVMVEWAE